MGAPCMQEKSHMREKEFDNHAIVALLKEKMCTVGTFSSEAQKYCIVSDAQNQYQQLLEPPKAIYKSFL